MLHPLVFIHGFAFGNYIFQSVIDTLPRGYDITLLSLPGHEGEPELSPDIEQWCEHYLPQIPQNAIIIGWSLGGLLAVKLAHKVPMKHLILLGTTPQFIRTPSWEYGIKPHNFVAFGDNLQADTEQALMRFMAMQGVSISTLRTLRKVIVANLPTLTSVTHALKVLCNTSAITEYETLSDKITLILGTRDYIVPVALSQWLESQNITTHILESGHMPFLTPEFSDLLQSILQNILESGAPND